MEREEIQRRVERVIIDSPYCIGTIKNGCYDSLYELGFDSLSVLELGADIQKEFNFTADIDISKYSTPEQIAAQVWKII